MGNGIVLDDKDIAHFTKNLQWAIDEMEDSIENEELSPTIRYVRGLVKGNLEILIGILLKKKALEAACQRKPE